LNIEPVGYVKRKEGASRHEIVDIILYEKYVDGLKGLEEFSHLFIVYYMHLASFKSLTKNCDGKNIGIFSTRSPNRPNPIGISVVRLIDIDKNVIKVEGINAINETPVLDIKPYDNWDSVLNPKIPPWYRACQKLV
jgi:tRNA-Thr(GGU) m(6)t(6)A37 methyltransferase TsaA